jgi:hypothetical protein
VLKLKSLAFNVDRVKFYADQLRFSDLFLVVSRLQRYQEKFCGDSYAFMRSPRGTDSGQLNLIISGGFSNMRIQSLFLLPPSQVLPLFYSRTDWGVVWK